ncbi:universal stress protein [Streptomyces sp. NPDC051310]|uniref:universal stress protein n=1 Tax=Streptomyces sp. NPDC051310 TaxID=3365649 RepID=UPI0037B8E09E
MTGAATPQERPVIVGVDRGPGPDDLVRFAAREAVLRRRPLHIVHAIELPLPGGSSSDHDESGSAAEAGARLVDHYERLAREESPSLSVAGELPMGHAAAVLIERSADAELIVLGHRGGGGVPRLPLGSVSWQVATHAECPVVVMRPSRTAERRTDAGRSCPWSAVGRLPTPLRPMRGRPARVHRGGTGRVRTPAPGELNGATGNEVHGSRLDPITTAGPAPHSRRTGSRS